MKIIGFIPCKLKSRRLERKNLEKIGGRSLLEISIDYLLNSSYIDHVYVSTDDGGYELIPYSDWKEVTVFKRTIEDPDAWLCDVYKDALNHMPNFDYMVTTNCDEPIKPFDLDKIIESVVKNKLFECFTYDPITGYKSGALTILKRKVIEKNQVCNHIKAILQQRIDIHTRRDLEHIRDQLSYLIPEPHDFQKMLEKDKEEFGHQL